MWTLSLTGQTEGVCEEGAEGGGAGGGLGGGTRCRLKAVCMMFLEERCKEGGW